MKRKIRYDRLMLLVAPCVLTITIPMIIVFDSMKYETLYVKENISVKDKPSFDADIVNEYYWNDKLVVKQLEDNLSKVKNKEEYIQSDMLMKNQVSSKNYDVPYNKIKSYMDYRAITDETSNQYKLQSSSHTYTNKQGLRMSNDRYCIALGSYYTTQIGQYVDVELENGKIIRAVLADCKADTDTDTNNQIHNTDGSVLEFVVDTDILDSNVQYHGDISFINDWDSKVVNIKVYDHVLEY